MTITVHGGAGGFTAHLEGIQAAGAALAADGRVLIGLGGGLQSAAAAELFSLATLWCPLESAQAAAGLSGAAAVVTASGLEAVATGELLSASVAAYRAADQACARLADDIEHLAAMAVGFAAVPLAVAAGQRLAPGLIGLAVTNPELAQRLAGMTAAEVDQYLYEHPEVMDELVENAPWLLQGAALWTGPVSAYLSGGRWPSLDYTDAVKGLTNVGEHFGVMVDDGRWTMGPVPYERVPGCPDHLVAPRSFTDLMLHQEYLNHADVAPNQIEITRVGEPPRYIVQVNCTQTWDVRHGEKLFDLNSNLHLMGGDDAQVAQQVRAAMAHAGIGADDPVMLVGYSQGGIAAGRLASDLNPGYTITNLVTFGAPVGRMDIPASVQVLSVEHETDLVAKLDGVDNPDRSHWTTVTQSVAAPPNSKPVGAVEDTKIWVSHEPLGYVETARAIDASTDPSIAGVADSARDFFTGDGVVQRYQIVRQQ